MELLLFTLKHFKGQWNNIILFLLASVVTSVVAVLLPFVNGNFIDTLVIAEDTEFIFKFGLAYLSLSLLIVLATYFSSLSFAKAHLETTFTLSKSVLEHIHNAKYIKYNKMNPAYLNNRINQDAATLSSFTIGTMSGLLINTITLIATFTMIFMISKVLSVILVGFLFFYIFAYITFRKPIYNRSLDLQEQRDIFHSRMFEQVQHSKFVKTHGAKEFLSKSLISAFNSYKRSFLPYQYLSLLYGGLDKAILYMAQAILLIIGGFQIVEGSLTIGSFTILAGYFASILASTSFYFTLGASYQRVKVSYSRIQDILSWENEYNGSINVENVNSIEVRELAFFYGDKQIFKSLNFCLEKGNIYALLGDNGAGKSTLIDVLLGLFDSNYIGKIKINEIPIENIDLYRMRQNNIGVVEQEPIFICESLTNNLFLGKTITEENNKFLAELINILGLNELVNSLSQGLETIISKESNFSGGEKQKIAITRVLLRDSEIMIFDEPTASLDEDTKEVFMEYLRGIKSSKIIVIITHDKYVIDCCDRLIYL